MKRRLSGLSVLKEPVDIRTNMNRCIRLCNNVILQFRKENEELKRELHIQKKACVCNIYSITRKVGKEFNLAD